MIYIDASVAIAHLLAEDHQPKVDFWSATLISSRLLEYEIYSVMNANRLDSNYIEAAQRLLSRIALLEMIPEILDRARMPFPVPLRTLDAMHVASIEFLREQRQEVQLASYDKRLVTAAERLGINVIALA